MFLYTEFHVIYLMSIHISTLSSQWKKMGLLRFSKNNKIKNTNGKFNYITYQISWDKLLRNYYDTKMLKTELICWTQFHVTNFTIFKMWIVKTYQKIDIELYGILYM